MGRISGLLVAVGVAASASIASPVPSRADNGQVAAGIIGGLAVGTLFGGAVAQPRYYEPAPVYVAPAPSPVTGLADGLFGMIIEASGFGHASRSVTRLRQALRLLRTS